MQLVILDLDGTLVDSLPDLTIAVNHMREGFGYPPLILSEVRKMVGQGARNLVERALPGASVQEVERGLCEFLAFNDAHLTDRTQLYPGVPETLDLLSRRGFTLAIISNKNVDLCIKLLALLGIDRYFSSVMGADSCPSRKPSPEPLLQLLREISVPAREAVMVGDSVNDIAAGKGAGVATVGCTYGYGEFSELAAADFLVDTFPALLDLPLFKTPSGT